MRAAIMFIVVIGQCSATAAFACSGCGCRGGPGYRGPNGQCVGWDRLHRICGSPPTTRCSAEGPPIGLHSRTAIPAVSKQEPAATVTPNKLTARTDGMGCVDQVSLQYIADCDNTRTAEECDGERALSTIIGDCSEIPFGTTVDIEPNSSHDRLYVRVPGTIRPLWTPRSLFFND